ncbi:MAG: hypothetical protein RLY31_1972 [Bacteroidota bacterium]|jgi:ketosteroid isomerase-like protein
MTYKPRVLSFVVSTLVPWLLPAQATTVQDGTLSAFVERYAASIDAADTAMARRLWADSPDISFIHPRGTAYGWEGIVGVYRMFADRFARRHLQPRNLKVSESGDAAWLTFEWVFDAVFRDNGAPLQTRGRETQVLRKVGGEWRLLHIHYSGMPAGGEREGF